MGQVRAGLLGRVGGGNLSLTTTVCGHCIDQLLFWTGILSMPAPERWVPGTGVLQSHSKTGPAQHAPASQAKPRAALRPLPAQGRAGATNRNFGSKYANYRWAGPESFAVSRATRQGASGTLGPVRAQGHRASSCFTGRQMWVQISFRTTSQVSSQGCSGDERCKRMCEQNTHPASACSNIWHCLRYQGRS